MDSADPGDEITFRQIDVVLYITQFGIEFFTQAQSHGWLQRYPVAAVEPADYRAEVKTDPGALIGVEAQRNLGVIVGPGWNEYAVINLEGFEQTLCREVDPGMNFRTVFPFQVVVDVQKTGFLKAVEIPVAGVGHVRPYFLQTDTAVLRPVPTQGAKHSVTVVFPVQKTYFRIEVLSHFHVVQIEQPVAGIVAARQRPGLVVTFQSRCRCAGCVT